MTEQVEHFPALVAEEAGDTVRLGIQELRLQDLPAHEVTIRVAYSSVNYKDGLASIKEGRVVRAYPIVPGIDLAGTVTASDTPAVKPGTKVLVTGYELGVSQHGGYAAYARVPADWVIPLPDGLSLRDAMLLGTAGFTAALSVHRLQENGVRPEQGPILVTGASGGVGSVAMAILAKAGYQVVASTGKEAAHDVLRALGATEVVSREAVLTDGSKPLERQRWAGAVDTVGGRTLSSILRNLRYGGSVAACGLTGGPQLDATVFPFILRGVNLLGIDSVYAPRDVRLTLWERLAKPWKVTDRLARAMTVVDLDALPEVLASILRGEVTGRVVVRVAP
ncbi:putative YhdH/YhfP family quinone oxidoreductase [Alicyclobacillus cycloheptanicus]|uniref:YhdH/YhfP family quinone oxidoreductase n=1 Tax=Alicyclobacillus cycloheptanicus TaxID=1457 RepID=A0ABT9XIT9_9BACL|nr:putative YhdH/YhfP family quinone oxidoreductase [Alicyclobacillus cycloheptanicus]